MFGKRNTIAPQPPAPKQPSAEPPRPEREGTDQLVTSGPSEPASAPPSDAPKPPAEPRQAPPPPDVKAARKPMESARSEEYYDVKTTVFNALIDTIDLTQLAKLDPDAAREEIRDI